VEITMRLQEALDALPAIGIPADFGRFREHIAPRWIEEALVATGAATVRRRRLPAEQVVWLVVGMALMRSESIERVAALLDLALPSSKGDVVAKSGIAQARQRLGDEPLAYLFLATAAEWATRSAARHQWRGLSLFGIDGSTMRVPDSVENWEAFGGHCGNGLRDGSAYPTVRVTALMALRSHLLLSLCVGDYATGEATLAKNLWREVPEDSLVVVDRNFLAAAELSELEKHRRHWLTRAKSTTQLRRLERLGPNEDLVEIELSRTTRRNAPDVPAVWKARAIQYHRKGFRPSTLLTSLLDAKRYPAKEIIALYHERWELEVGYDEIKTHLLAREETIRSRTAQGVRQEIWGLAIAYNLVRLEMERAADEAGVPPTRISFVGAMALIRNAWLIWSTSPLAPGRIPKGLLNLRHSLKLLLIPERRADRSYPRAVKIKLSPYQRKRPTGDGRN
jgi:hypothetical protein